VPQAQAQGKAQGLRPRAYLRVEDLYIINYIINIRTTVIKYPY
jgi:hypothetical protein